MDDFSSIGGIAEPAHSREGLALTINLGPSHARARILASRGRRETTTLLLLLLLLSGDHKLQQFKRAF